MRIWWTFRPGSCFHCETQIKIAFFDSFCFNIACYHWFYFFEVVEGFMCVKNNGWHGFVNGLNFCLRQGEINDFVDVLLDGDYDIRDLGEKLCEIGDFVVGSWSKHMIIIISNCQSKKLLSFGKIICVFPSFELIFVLFVYLFRRGYFLYWSIFWSLFRLAVGVRAIRFLRGVAFWHLFLLLIFIHWLFVIGNYRYSWSDMALNLCPFHYFILALERLAFLFLFMKIFLWNNFKKSSLNSCYFGKIRIWIAYYT